MYRNKWVPSKYVPTEVEIKSIIAEFVKQVIKMTFNGHVYKFGNKIYLQNKGGPIGLRLSGAVARLVLLWFDDRVIDIAKVNNVKVIMYKRYIDDIDGAWQTISKGYSYNKSTE